MADLTLEQRKKVEASVGQALEKAIPAELAQSLGQAFSVDGLGLLGGALKLSVRAQLAAELGIGVTTAGSGAPVTGAPSLGSSLAPTAKGSSVTPAATTAVKSSLTAKLGLSLDAALLGLGLAPSEQQATKAKLQPRLADALSRAVASAVVQVKAYPSALGSPVLDGEVMMQATGPWHATLTVDLDEESPPTGQFVFQEGGIEFRGTILPSRAGAHGGTTKIKVVGGAGGLSRTLPARNYAGGVTRVKTVVDDILRDSGETLSSTSDASLLARQLTGWQRASGQNGEGGRGSDALTLLCDQFGANWRVLRDGTVWIGTDAWPEVEPDGVVEDANWSDGSVLIAGESPTHVPGTIVLGQRVESVIHTWNAKGLQTELRANSIRGAMGAFLRKVRAAGDFSNTYRCKVDRQNSDGSVDVTVTDDRMKGRGVGRCKVRVGIPLATLKINTGATCLVGWEDGNPQLPYVSHFEQGASATSVQVGDNSRGVAYVGATVTVPWPPVLPFSGTVGGLPAAGVITVVEAGVGIIETGSDKLLV
jgi:hypothetical protein